MLFCNFLGFQWLGRIAFCAIAIVRTRKFMNDAGLFCFHSYAEKKQMKIRMSTTSKPKNLEICVKIQVTYQCTRVHTSIIQIHTSNIRLSTNNDSIHKRFVRPQTYLYLLTNKVMSNISFHQKSLSLLKIITLLWNELFSSFHIEAKVARST